MILYFHISFWKYFPSNINFSSYKLHECNNECLFINNGGFNNWDVANVYAKTWSLTFVHFGEGRNSALVHHHLGGFFFTGNRKESNKRF